MMTNRIFILYIIILFLGVQANDQQNSKIYIIKNKIFKTDSISKISTVDSSDTSLNNSIKKSKKIQPPIKFLKKPLSLGCGIGFSTLGTDEINELLYNIYVIRLTESGIEKIPKFEGKLSNSLNFLTHISFDPFRFLSIGMKGKIGFSYDDTDDVLSSMKEQDATLYNFSGGVTIALNFRAYNRVYPRLGGSLLGIYSTLKITTFDGDAKLTGHSFEGQIYTGLGLEFSRLKVTLDLGINLGRIPYSLVSSSLITEYPYNYKRTLNLLGFNFAATTKFKIGK